MKKTKKKNSHYMNINIITVHKNKADVALTSYQVQVYTLTTERV